MDKKLIEQFGEDILCYTLPTVRQKKRKQYIGFQRHLFLLNREMEQLYADAEKLGWIELDEPIQRGYKRTFVLRCDVAISKDAALYESILKSINNVQYSHKKDFTKKARRWGKKVQIEISQHLNTLSIEAFEKAGFTEKERSCFYLDWKMDATGRTYFYYTVKDAWRFVLQVQPNLIHKVRIINTEMESRQAEIENYLTANAYWNKIEKIQSGNVFKCWKSWKALPHYKTLAEGPKRTTLQLLNESEDF